MSEHDFSFAREMARMEAHRASWCQARAQADAITKQMRAFSLSHTALAQLTNTMKSLRSPAMRFAQQYQDVLSANSSALQSINVWQMAERAQNEAMRRLLDPLDGIRKRLLLDGSAQKLIKELTAANSIQNHSKPFVAQTSGIGSIVGMLTRQAEESRQQHGRWLDSVAGSSIQNYLKDFEAVNRQWRVPDEVSRIIGSFKDIQERLGRVSLPTIDWGAAGALAEVLGEEGINEQLAHLGIGPDGTMLPSAEMPQKGIFSRKQSDVLTLISLLFTVLSFFYQELSHRQDKAQAEALQAAQAQQIQSLTILIEQLLPQAVQAPEVRFVVRERPAKVRSTPEHGASVEGKLLPNEVVSVIDRQGRWVEIEYYHWLHEEYRTGWVLKHYLERVPPSYSRNNKTAGDGSPESPV